MAGRGDATSLCRPTQPARSKFGCQSSRAGAGSTLPVLTQMVLCPRHFIAAIPATQRTPPAGPSSLSWSGAGMGSVCFCGCGCPLVPGLCSHCWEGVPCWQQGIVQPGFPWQQEGVAGFLGGGGSDSDGVEDAVLPEQQHWPLWHLSAVAQPHLCVPHAGLAEADRESAGRGKPKAAAR